MRRGRGEPKRAFWACGGAGDCREWSRWARLCSIEANQCRTEKPLQGRSTPSRGHGAAPHPGPGGALQTPAAPPLLIGTAGWTIPREAAEAFAGEGTHLQRYTGRLAAAEINSSFHRPHRASTYARWRASVPPGFLFSVKLPKTITHGARLREAEPALDDFLPGVRELGETLGCLLVQLPPSLVFEPEVAERFFAALRERHDGGIACEPRHESWLAPAAVETMTSHRVARVAADPDRPAGAGEPGGWEGMRYYRLHGSPRVYYSSYSPEWLGRLAERLAAERSAGRTTWCIFDNTASGAATGDALELMRLTESGAAGGGD